MTAKKLALALMEPDWKTCVQTLLPPWCEGVEAEEARAKEAWRTVRTLRDQHDQLVQIFPHKKAELDQQFNKALMAEARAGHEALFELTA
jgi:hypothetical protein